MHDLRSLIEAKAKVLKGQAMDESEDGRPAKHTEARSNQGTGNGAKVTDIVTVIELAKQARENTQHLGLRFESFLLDLAVTALRDRMVK